jgi:hypothetical protein
MLTNDPEYDTIRPWKGSGIRKTAGRELPRKTLGKEQSKNEFTLSTNFKKSVDKIR